MRKYIYKFCMVMALCVIAFSTADLHALQLESLTPGSTESCEGCTKCPCEDNSRPSQSPGDDGIDTDPTLGLRIGLNFGAICAMLGGDESLCEMLSDCLDLSNISSMEMKDDCPLMDCINDPGTDKCMKLCKYTPDNVVCAAANCLKRPSSACCSVLSGGKSIYKQDSSGAPIMVDGKPLLRKGVPEICALLDTCAPMLEVGMAVYDEYKGVLTAQLESMEGGSVSVGQVMTVAVGVAMAVAAHEGKAAAGFGESLGSGGGSGKLGDVTGNDGMSDEEVLAKLIAPTGDEFKASMSKLSECCDVLKDSDISSVLGVLGADMSAMCASPDRCMTVFIDKNNLADLKSDTVFNMFKTRGMDNVIVSSQCCEPLVEGLILEFMFELAYSIFPEEMRDRVDEDTVETLLRDFAPSLLEKLEDELNTWVKPICDARKCLVDWENSKTDSEVSAVSPECCDIMDKFSFIPDELQDICYLAAECFNKLDNNLKESGCCGATNARRNVTEAEVASLASLDCDKERAVKFEREEKIEGKPIPTFANCNNKLIEYRDKIDEGLIVVKANRWANWAESSATAEEKLRFPSRVYSAAELIKDYYCTFDHYKRDDPDPRCAIVKGMDCSGADKVACREKLATTCIDNPATCQNKSQAIWGFDKKCCDAFTAMTGFALQLVGDEVKNEIQEILETACNMLGAGAECLAKWKNTFNPVLGRGELSPQCCTFFTDLNSTAKNLGIGSLDETTMNDIMNFCNAGASCVTSLAGYFAEDATIIIDGTPMPVISDPTDPGFNLYVGDECCGVLNSLPTSVRDSIGQDVIDSVTAICSSGLNCLESYNTQLNDPARDLTKPFQVDTECCGVIMEVVDTALGSNISEDNKALLKNVCGGAANCYMNLKKIPIDGQKFDEDDPKTYEWGGATAECCGLLSAVTDALLKTELSGINIDPKTIKSACVGTKQCLKQYEADKAKKDADPNHDIVLSPECCSLMGPMESAGVLPAGMEAACKSGVGCYGAYMKVEDSLGMKYDGVYMNPDNKRLTGECCIVLGAVSGITSPPPDAGEIGTIESEKMTALCLGGMECYANFTGGEIPNEFDADMFRPCCSALEYMPSIGTTAADFCEATLTIADGCYQKLIDGEAITQECCDAAADIEKIALTGKNDPVDMSIIATTCAMGITGAQCLEAYNKTGKVDAVCCGLLDALPVPPDMADMCILATQCESALSGGRMDRACCSVLDSIAGADSTAKEMCGMALDIADCISDFSGTEMINSSCCDATGTLFPQLPPEIIAACNDPGKILDKILDAAANVQDCIDGAAVGKLSASCCKSPLKDLLVGESLGADAIEACEDPSKIMDAVTNIQDCMSVNPLSSGNMSPACCKLLPDGKDCDLILGCRNPGANGQVPPHCCDILPSNIFTCEANVTCAADEYLNTNVTPYVCVKK